MAATANCGRHVKAREIRDAVRNSVACAWTPKGGEVGGGSKTTAGFLGGLPDDAPAPDFAARWRARNECARLDRIADSAASGVSGLADLWEVSPVKHEKDADDWLEWLFPDAEWLCIAESHPGSARTRRAEKWMFGPAESSGLIVPSPMTAARGERKDGKSSARCLDNTGPRLWLVVEFDKLADGKTSMPIDEQAALHWHFRESSAACGWPRLGIVVHSGGKSLHGWYYVAGDEDAAHELMSYAVSLGADPATWVRCQFVRMPGGMRGVQRQEVFFFDPTCKTPNLNISFTEHGMPSVSAQLHALTEAA